MSARTHTHTTNTIDVAVAKAEATICDNTPNFRLRKAKLHHPNAAKRDFIFHSLKQNGNCRRCASMVTVGSIRHIIS